MINDDNTQDKDDLLTKLRRYFNKSDLRDICFTLGIEYEDLAGGTKQDKTRELVLHLERRGQIKSLVSLCRDLRPNISWDIPEYQSSDRQTFDIKKVRDFLGSLRQPQLVALCQERFSELLDSTVDLDTPRVRIINELIQYAVVLEEIDVILEWGKNRHKKLYDKYAPYEITPN